MEDSLARTYSSQSLKSQKFNKLHCSNIGNWLIKMLNDNFHINYFQSFSFSEFIKINRRDNKESNKRMNQLKMQINKKKNDDPEFFKNCFESNPLSENCTLIAVSFFTLSKSIPMLLMNLGIQSSVQRISKKMYFIRKPRMVYGSPGIEI